MKTIKSKVSMVKSFVAGVLVMALFSGTLVMANPVTREIFLGVGVSVDGQAVEFAEDSQPFIMEGRTFLPVGALSDALGFEVEWDAENSVAMITSPTPVVPVSLPTPLAPVETATEDNASEEVSEEVVEAAPAINPITVAEITALQVAWGEGLVAISTAYAEGEDYGTIAQGVLDALYGYVDGFVLFKPTVAQEVPFRFTEAAAASYFIGGSIEEDGGFALNPWTAVRFGADGQHIINGETALWMGSVFLTDGDGEEIRVEKSLGLYRDANGDVRIQLHHSSVPFEG